MSRVVCTDVDFLSSRRKKVFSSGLLFIKSTNRLNGGWDALCDVGLFDTAASWVSEAEVNLRDGRQRGQRHGRELYSVSEAL